MGEQSIRRRLRSKTTCGEKSGGSSPCSLRIAIEGTTGSPYGESKAASPWPPAKRQCRRFGHPLRSWSDAAADTSGKHLSEKAAFGVEKAVHELSVNGLLQLIWAFAFP